MLDVRGRQSEMTPPPIPTGQLSGPPPVGSNEGQLVSSSGQIKADPSALGSDSKGSKGSTRIFSVDNQGSGRTVLIFWIIMSVIVFGVGFFANFQTSNARTREATFSNQVSEGQARLSSGDLASTIKQLQKMVDQKNTYTDFTENSLIWSQILLEFSDKVPSNIRITELSFAEDGSLIVKGEGAKYVDVANLSVALKSSAIFENVNITNSTHFTGSSGSAINFDMQAIYKGVTQKNRDELFNTEQQSSANQAIESTEE